MSFPNLPPLSATSESLWSLKADPPEEGQPSVVGEAATGSPTPIDDSTVPKNARGCNLTDEFVYHGWDEADCVSFSAFVRDANSYDRSVDPYIADEFGVPPPERTAIRLMEHSFDPLGGDCNGWWNESDGGGASFSAFAHDANSYGRFDDPCSNKEAPGLTDFAQRDQTNNGSSMNMLDIKGELLTLKELGFSDVLTIPETTTIYEAGCLLKDNLDVLVVTDSNGLPCGTFEDQDIWKEVNAPAIVVVKNMPVSSVMTKSSMFVSPDTLGVDAVKMMMEGEVKKLAVVKNDKVIGLVSRSHCQRKIAIRNSVEKKKAYFIAHFLARNMDRDIQRRKRMTMGFLENDEEAISP